MGPASWVFFEINGQVIVTATLSCHRRRAVDCARTRMLFGDAKDTIEKVVSELKKTASAAA
jgi:hypothetical protein